jgi:toxin ParE1/3/4
MEAVRKSYRVAKVKSHHIFYRVVNDRVQIVRILHESMDIESRLDD